MANALVGFSGFVGSTLCRQTHFEFQYRSTNISEIHGRSFDTVVCAGASAQKWLANREPAEDRNRIGVLIENLKHFTCKNFILISTVDVFKSPILVDEGHAVDENGLHAYGLHRRLLEKFVEDQFESCLIVRLPGLVGPGLRKNVIFDLLNDNNVQAVDSRGIFQFYPTVNLWYDIEIALRAELRLIHLTAEPISVATLAEHGFGRTFDHTLATNPARYDLRTRHAHLFGAQDSYQYTARETIQAVRAYAQSEPVSKKAD